jgi:hypothetical protein
MLECAEKQIKISSINLYRKNLFLYSAAIFNISDSYCNRILPLHLVGC